MAKSLLAQLRTMTTVVADTGDIDAIQKARPQDATTNPSLLTAAAQMPAYSSIVDGVLLDAKKQLGDHADDAKIAKLAFENLAVAFGKKILAIIPGRVSTEVDARLSYDTARTIQMARDIIEMYRKEGIGRERVLIKPPPGRAFAPPKSLRRKASTATSRCCSRSARRWRAATAASR